MIKITQNSIKNYRGSWHKPKTIAYNSVTESDYFGVFSMVIKWCIANINIIMLLFALTFELL